MQFALDHNGSVPPQKLSVFKSFVDGHFEQASFVTSPPQPNYTLRSDFLRLFFFVCEILHGTLHVHIVCSNREGTYPGHPLIFLSSESRATINSGDPRERLENGRSRDGRVSKQTKVRLGANKPYGLCCGDDDSSALTFAKKLIARANIGSTSGVLLATN